MKFSTRAIHVGPGARPRHWLDHSSHPSQHNLYSGGPRSAQGIRVFTIAEPNPEGTRSSVWLLLKKEKSAQRLHRAWRQPRPCFRRWNPGTAWWVGMISMEARSACWKECSSVGDWKSPLLPMPVLKRMSGQLHRCAVRVCYGSKHRQTRSWTSWISPALARLAKTHSMTVAVDNTFATPYLQKPLSPWGRPRDSQHHQVSGRALGCGGRRRDCRKKETMEAIRFLQNAAGGVPESDGLLSAAARPEDAGRSNGSPLCECTSNWHQS